MPRDGAQQRRLAGAVRAEEGDALALGDLEVDAEEDLDAAVADVEVADGQQRCAPGVALGGVRGAGGGRLPHLGDVVGDRVLRASQQEAADEEGRHEQEHARPGGSMLVADPTDDRQDHAGRG